MRRLIFLFLLLCALGTLRAQTASVSLNGSWEAGDERRYDRTVEVPGIVADPSRPNDGRLWYRREIVLPEGDWTAATLELCGARFRPEVFVDGVSVSRAEGGMAATRHPLTGRRVRPGGRIVLEVALESLADVPQEDASCIPVADRWRTNNSSGLWDDVNLHFHYAATIGDIVLFPDLGTKSLRIDYRVAPLPGRKLRSGRGTLTVRDDSGRKLLEEPLTYRPGKNSVEVAYGGKLAEWSPEHPARYTMELRLDTRDCRTMPFGIKEFRVEQKQFRLNGRPCPLRGSTVVWHRWVRTEEGPGTGTIPRGSATTSCCA